MPPHLTVWAGAWVATKDRHRAIIGHTFIIHLSEGVGRLEGLNVRRLGREHE